MAVQTDIRLGRVEAADLAGVPHPLDQINQGFGGRRRLRRLLYAAALPAAYRWNPALGELYQRLIKHGKGHKRALIACTRKLLICAKTVQQRDTPWTKHPDAAA